MQEKISTIIPPKSTDNVAKLNLADKNQTLPLENNVSKDNVSKNNTSESNVSLKNNLTHEIINNQNKLLTDNTLDSLALSVLANMNTKLTGDEQHITEALEVDDDWSVITEEDEIIETAKEFLGVKYVWAANGPDAFDCSGFTKYVFEKHGITLPRYSGYQAHIGTKVAYNKLKKGDLVFFGTDKKGKVNHVGIYLGDHKFIHASSGGKKVMITSFIQKKFYRNRFLHGQRIVHSNNFLASL